MPKPAPSNPPPAVMLAAIAALVPALGAEIVDSVAAIVGSEAITMSQVRSQLQMVALLNHVAPDSLDAGGETALRRLIDRRLVMQDLALTPFLLSPPEKIEGHLEALRTQTFAGGRNFRAALAQHGLTEDDCRSFLGEQASFERYVSFRFKSGQDVSREAVEAYYRSEYVPGQAALDATVEPLESVQAQIAEELAERRANILLDQRIKELRALTRIEILAFKDGRPTP